MPFLEQQDLYNQINLNKYYRSFNADGVTSSNAVACARPLPIAVCPSNPFTAFKDTWGLQNVTDPATGQTLLAEGKYWGNTDYFATVYTSISDGSSKTAGAGKIGWDDKTNYRADGALAVDNKSHEFDAGGAGEGGFFANATSVPISAIIDGTSNTICFIEDAGRTNPLMMPPQYAYQGTPSHYGAPTINPDGTPISGAYVDAGLPRDTIANPDSGKEPTAVWRWADADACGSGISGPAAVNNTQVTATTNPQDFDTAGNYTGKVINQNANPLGGPTISGLPGWQLNNVGLNDEPFSFHQGGCNAVMVDGSVHFLSEAIDPVTLRRLVTRAEGKTIDTDVAW